MTSVSGLKKKRSEGVMTMSMQRRLRHLVVPADERVPPLRATDVTFERLLHPEPQNRADQPSRLQRATAFAADSINKSNVKNIKLLFAVALGGSAANDALEGTPLVDDGSTTCSTIGAVYNRRA